MNIIEQERAAEKVYDELLTKIAFDERLVQYSVLHGVAQTIAQDVLDANPILSAKLVDLTEILYPEECISADPDSALAVLVNKAMVVWFENT